MEIPAAVRTAYSVVWLMEPYIVRRDPRLEASPLAVPPHVVEDAEEVHGGAVRGHPQLVGRHDAARHEAGLVVVFE